MWSGYPLAINDAMVLDRSPFGTTAAESPLFWSLAHPWGPMAPRLVDLGSDSATDVEMADGVKAEGEVCPVIEQDVRRAYGHSWQTHGTMTWQIATFRIDFSTYQEILRKRSYR